MSKLEKIPEHSALISEELKNQMLPLFNKIKKKVRFVAVLDLEDENLDEIIAGIEAAVKDVDPRVVLKRA